MILFWSALCAMFTWKPVRENSVTSKEEERLLLRKKNINFILNIYREDGKPDRNRIM